MAARSRATPRRVGLLFLRPRRLRVRPARRCARRGSDADRAPPDLLPVRRRRGADHAPARRRGPGRRPGRRGSPRSCATPSIAIEDQRFYDHAGLDLRAAPARRLHRRHDRRGRRGRLHDHPAAREEGLRRRRADAHPQDPTRPTSRGSSSTGSRKEQILTKYLNTVYFGNGAYGIMAAARTYFDKDPIDLTLGEAAFLAGAIAAPVTYDPADPPEPRAQPAQPRARAGCWSSGWSSRRDTRRRRTSAIELHMNEEDDQPYLAPYFVDYFKEWFLSNPRFGETLGGSVQAAVRGWAPDRHDDRPADAGRGRARGPGRARVSVRTRSPRSRRSIRGPGTCGDGGRPGLLERGRPFRADQPRHRREHRAPGGFGVQAVRARRRARERSHTLDLAERLQRHTSCCRTGRTGSRTTPRAAATGRSRSRAPRATR